MRPGEPEGLWLKMLNLEQKHKLVCLMKQPDKKLNIHTVWMKSANTFSYGRFKMPILQQIKENQVKYIFYMHFLFMYIYCQFNEKHVKSSILQLFVKIKSQHWKQSEEASYVSVLSSKDIK